MSDPPIRASSRAADEFSRHRRLLWGIAYRMLGTASDAEDVVQDTFVRLLRSPPADQDELRPWLVRVAVNLARDQLRRRKTRGYVGSWLPAPVSSEGDVVAGLPGPDEVGPESRYSMLESLSFGFLLAAEKLTPDQRAVMILRDVFGCSSAETAGALQIEEGNVRVILHRARGQMRQWESLQRRRLDAPHERVLEVMQRFVAAVGRGDLEGAEQTLAADVVLLSDGGGEFFAARVPVVGAAKVAGFYVKLANRPATVAFIRPRLVNGQTAIDVGFEDRAAREAPRAVLAFELDAADRIAAIYAVLAPSKLASLELSPSDSPP